MKNFWFTTHPFSNGWVKKFILTMKLTIFILFLGLMQVSASVYSQATKFTFSYENKKIAQVLREIEDDSKFRFFYLREQVDVERKVSVSANDATVEQILDELFKGHNVKYELMNDFLIVLSKGVTSESSVSVQQNAVSGKVTDPSGQPLPGVSIVIKGTTQGTVTDTEGNYTLTNLPADAVLVYSFVGMKSKEVVVGNQTSINVNLEEDVIGIEEVVAIGYGTMKKSDLTGAVQRIDMGGKEMAANVSLSQALQGYIPGLNVGASSSAGSMGSISIRGRTSLSASDDPLIVLDGVIFNGNLADVNVNDIESIDILKDASSAAVYGSRSANGVIIVTTKMGTSEKPLFTFNASYGFQNISNTKMMDVMNGDQLAVSLVDYYYYLDELLPWYSTNPTSAAGRPQRPDVTNKQEVAFWLRSEQEKNNYLAGKETDWIGKTIQPAPLQNYSLSVSGKSGGSTYFLSLSYTDQTGVVVNDEFNRATLRANYNNQINDWLSFGLNTSYSHLDYSGVAASLWNARHNSPLANYANEDGSFPMILNGESYQMHPVGNYIPIRDSDLSDRLNVLVSGEVKIPQIKGLSYKVNYINHLNLNNHKQFAPVTVFAGNANNGAGSRLHQQQRGWLIDNIISYENTFAEKHKIDVTLLYNAENRHGDASTLTAEDFDVDALGYDQLSLGKIQNIATSAWEENSIAYLGRINYIYDERYLITATYRRDGYSGFGENKKFADFPSVSLAWVPSEENFLENTDWLNFLKLRVSYGVNGNQGIGRYASLSKMGTSAYIYDNKTAVTVYPTSMGNVNLGWEKTTSLNFGLDFSIIDQRISGNIDNYYATTSDVLVLRSIPRATGFSNIWTNIGGIKNKGIEITLDTWNVKSSSLNWKSNFVFSLNRNEITKLYDDIQQDIGNSWFVGEPINSIYGYEPDGVWQEEDLFSGNIHPDFYPGMFKIKDHSDDDAISPVDRTIVGYRDPNYRFGINNSLSYNNWSFSFFFNSIQGGNGYYIEDNYDATQAAGKADRAFRTNHTTTRSYWTPDNPVNNAVAMYYSPPYEPGAFESRAFVRLQDITLSYDLAKAITNRYGLNGVQLYVSGKNIYTWTKWSGWDPEISGDTPMMRSIIGGIKVSF